MSQEVLGTTLTSSEGSGCWKYYSGARPVLGGWWELPTDRLWSQGRSPGIIVIIIISNKNDNIYLTRAIQLFSKLHWDHFYLWAAVPGPWYSRAPLDSPSLVWFTHQRTTCPKLAERLQKGLPGVQVRVKTLMLLCASLEAHPKGHLREAWSLTPTAFTKHFLWGGAGALQHPTLSSLHPARRLDSCPHPISQRRELSPRRQGGCAQVTEVVSGGSWIQTQRMIRKLCLQKTSLSAISDSTRLPALHRTPREKVSHPSSTSPKACTCLSLGTASASSTLTVRAGTASCLCFLLVVPRTRPGPKEAA